MEQIIKTYVSDIVVVPFYRVLCAKQFSRIAMAVSTLYFHLLDSKLRWINLAKQVVELGFGHNLTPVPLFLIITLTYHYLLR